MAKTFKPLLGDDTVTTRTLLHEAIPITGTISSGTYQAGGAGGTELNIKTFSHGMYQSVYDYPYLSSSANHIFDVSYGCSSNASSSANTQNAKKLNIYNQMAQVLLGYNVSGTIRKFESDGTIDGAGQIMNHCFFINNSRLLVKDEIKKGSYRLKLYTSGTVEGNGTARTGLITLGDYGSATEYRTCPAGDYGLIYTSSADTTSSATSTACKGLVFYQAGIVALTSSLFLEEFGAPGDETAIGGYGGANTGINHAQTSSTIDKLANGFRHMVNNIDFNNTIELNSAIYFCRVNHNEYNYSANPTYISGSKIVVKNNVSDLPVSYITSVGLYSPDNELLAVAKLSEPIRKDPNTELTLRVRLDY